jgi:hypothetical protein
MPVDSQEVERIRRSTTFTLADKVPLIDRATLIRLCDECEYQRKRADTAEKVSKKISDDYLLFFDGVVLDAEATREFVCDIQQRVTNLETLAPELEAARKVVAFLRNDYDMGIDWACLTALGRDDRLRELLSDYDTAAQRKDV